MTHPFIEISDEIFAFAGDAVSAVGFSRVVEKRALNSHPVMAGIDWHSDQGGPGPEIDITFNAISDARRARGDVVDFELCLTPRGPVPPTGAYLTLTIPFNPSALGDGRFAMIGALSLRMSRTDTFTGAHLGFAERGGFVHLTQMPVATLSHGALGWRFAAPPAEPSLLLRLYCRAFDGPITLRVGRAFAGLEYDAYSFNPHFEKRRALSGPRIGGRAAEACSEFLRLAEEAMRTHDFRGAQAFNRPFIVHREGEPDFDMLIGNPNSIAWYAIDTHHGGSIFKTDIPILPKDVVLDCGAHAGEIATIFGKMTGAEGRVIAFDPFPQNYLQVECQAILNDMPYLSSTRSGVGREAGTVMTPLELQQTDGGIKGFDQATLFPLRLEALDSYADERPTFIKLDVEGAEVEALYGAQHLLRTRTPRLFIEVHPQFQKQFGVTCREMFELIPRDLYRIEYNVEGAPAGWNEYKIGDEDYFADKVGGYVRAYPR